MLAPNPTIDIVLDAMKKSMHEEGRWTLVMKKKLGVFTRSKEIICAELECTLTDTKTEWGVCITMYNDLYRTFSLVRYDEEVEVSDLAEASISRHHTIPPSVVLKGCEGALNNKQCLSLLYYWDDVVLRSCKEKKKREKEQAGVERLASLYL